MKETIARREFVKRAAQVAAVAAVGETVIASAAPTERPGPSAGALPTRTLGKTGLKLPILGYGGAGLPTRWGNPLSQEDRVALLRRAYDQGVRYFDTAPCYFESQAIMGEALKDRRRDVCLVTKVDGTNPAIVRKQVETSLKTLQTDHADILLIHGTPGLEQMSVAQAMKVIGAGMLGVRSGVLVPDFDKQRLKQLPAAAIRHTLQDERVHVLNIGMRLKVELDANLKVLAGPAASTPADRALLADYAAKLYETPAFKKLRLE